MAAQGHAGRGTGTYVTTYIDGNVVRHIQAEPARRQQTAPGTLSREVRRNRERALHMSVAYVTFLAAAAITTVFLCVQYLQLQAQGVTYRNTIARLESELNAAQMANDTAYEEAISSVNMEQIKETAIHELGMVYADQGQIIRYDRQNGDYVRQYAQIPQE